MERIGDSAPVGTIRGDSANMHDLQMRDSTLRRGRLPKMFKWKVASSKERSDGAGPHACDQPLRWCGVGRERQRNAERNVYEGDGEPGERVLRDLVERRPATNVGKECVEHTAIAFSSSRVVVHV